MTRHFIVVVVTTLLGGCGHQALRDSTLDLASTVAEIQYQQVLNNVAMLHEKPYAIPAFVRLGEGTIGIVDRIGPTITVTDPSGTGITGTYSGAAQRQWQHQWRVSPVTAREDVERLVALYDVLLGRLPQTDTDDKVVKALTNATKVEESLKLLREDVLGGKVKTPVDWFVFGDDPNSPLRSAKYGETVVSLKSGQDAMKAFRQFTLLTLKATKKTAEAADLLKFFGRD